MDFIKNLAESRMTRDAKNHNVLSYSDCGERLYIMLLAIEFMRQFAYAAPFVQRYCKNTNHNNYKHFKISGTDCYNLLYFLLGDEAALKKLKDPSAAAIVQKQTIVPTKLIGEYFLSVANGNVPTSLAQLFIRLENGLNINNQVYRNIRRNLLNFNKASSNEKNKIATKILFALRAKCRTSDIIDDFSKLVAKKDLENNKVTDTEPTISLPDLPATTSKELVFYKMLVDQNNLLLIKAFIDYARKGQSIPSNMVKAYMPIIKLIDDIVSGGPTYVNLLKSIHKRAKKSR